MARTTFDQLAPRDLRLRLLDALLETTEPVVITEPVQACCDPNDDKVLELAISGGANLIVSSDEDLLILHPFHGTPIIQPNIFLRLYTAPGGGRYDPES